MKLCNKILTHNKKPIRDRFRRIIVYLDQAEELNVIPRDATFKIRDAIREFDKDYDVGIYENQKGKW